MARQKGVIDIEFILSVFVFLGVVVFVTFVIIGNIPVFHREALNENLRARAYQASQLLVFDEGEPSNWDTSNVRRIGLQVSTGDAYRISRTKITNLATLCNDYDRLRSLLVQDVRHDVRINITGSSGQPLLDCGPPVRATLVPEFPITRYAVLDDGTNTIVMISVSIT